MNTNRQDQTPAKYIHDGDSDITWPNLDTARCKSQHGREIGSGKAGSVSVVGYPVA